MAQGNDVKPIISIVYPTCRLGGIDILKDNLDRQTFKDFEIVIGDELYDSRAKLVKWYLSKYKVKHFKPQPPKPGYVWNLNSCYNEMVKMCEGTFIVSLQDFICISARGLERFWDMHKLHPMALITGVGHKAKNPEKIEIQDPLLTFDTITKPTGISETDERMMFREGLHEQNYSYFELNWASFPTGYYFDESMDQFYGGDNAVFALQTKLPVFVDRSNECVGYNQALFGRPHDWEEKHQNKEGRLNKRIWDLNQTH